MFSFQFSISISIYIYIYITHLVDWWVFHFLSSHRSHSYTVNFRRSAQAIPPRGAWLNPYCGWWQWPLHGRCSTARRPAVNSTLQEKVTQYDHDMNLIWDDYDLIMVYFDMTRIRLWYCWYDYDLIMVHFVMIIVWLWYMLILLWFDYNTLWYDMKFYDYDTFWFNWLWFDLIWS